MEHFISGHEFWGVIDGFTTKNEVDKTKVINLLLRMPRSSPGSLIWQMQPSWSTWLLCGQQRQCGIVKMTRILRADRSSIIS